MILLPEKLDSLWNQYRRSSSKLPSFYIFISMLVFYNSWLFIQKMFLISRFTCYIAYPRWIQIGPFIFKRSNKRAVPEFLSMQETIFECFVFGCLKKTRLFFKTKVVGYDSMYIFDSILVESWLLLKAPSFTSFANSMYSWDLHLCHPFPLHSAVNSFVWKKWSKT